MIRSLAFALAAILAVGGSAAAQGSCAHAPAQAAAQTGGQPIGAPRLAGNSCIVTVLVQGAPGKPPKRVTVSVPAR